MAFRAPKYALGLAAGLAIAAATSAMFAAPEASRTLSIYNIHTKETLTVLYKKDGKFIPEAMKQINWIMRDWRRDEIITMDPAVIDLLWEVYQELGSREPIQLICGHRSRATNEMLRRTVGGQASQSQHIVGKAIDVAFPDVPIRQLRYAGLIRERGGVGYYPTSAIPFVHLDTDRVRHWPRIPRHELALLFPNGKSKHVPQGGPLTLADVRAAREKKDLVTQVAEFFAARQRPRTPAVLVAGAAGPPIPRPLPAKASTPEWQVAVLTPPPDFPAPQLVGAPRLVERPSRLRAGPSLIERGQLDRLVKAASYETAMGPPAPTSVAQATSGPSNADREGLTRLAALTAPDAERPKPTIATDASLSEGGWVAAPAFDEEHPEELSYRPFPVAPMLTESASPDDPVLVVMRHPDLALTLDMIDDEGSVPPLRFRPGQQVARLLWAQQFQGAAVGYETLSGEDAGGTPAGLAQRSVKTSSR